MESNSEVTITAVERKRKQRQRDRDDPARKTRKLDTLYMFGDVPIAIILDADGVIWFKEVDLARALEYEDHTHAISNLIDIKFTKSYDNLNVTIGSNTPYCDIPGIHPKTMFVNEAGMNMFVMRSRKPKAEAFTEWVCGTVLPSIRRSGRYEIKNPEENPYKVLNDFYKQRITEIEEALKKKDSALKEKDSTINILATAINTKDNQLSKTINKLFESF